jgi:hypothetical protein
LHTKNERVTLFLDISYWISHLRFYCRFLHPEHATLCQRIVWKGLWLNNRRIKRTCHFLYLQTPRNVPHRLIHHLSPNFRLNNQPKEKFLISDERHSYHYKPSRFLFLVAHWYFIELSETNPPYLCPTWRSDCFWDVLNNVPASCRRGVNKTVLYDAHLKLTKKLFATYLIFIHRSYNLVSDSFLLISFWNITKLQRKYCLHIEARIFHVLKQHRSHTLQPSTAWKKSIDSETFVS